MERNEQPRVFPPQMPRFAVGDRVKVARSGRTGTVVSRCQPERDGWTVRWDEPQFGAEVSRVATVNLEMAHGA